MSTIKTTNITHGSNSGTNNLILDSSGNLAVAGYITDSTMPYAMMGINALQSVANNSSHAIVWQETTDRSSNFDPSNGRFTAPIAGDYLCNLSVQFTGQVNALHTGIFKNGGGPGDHFDPWINWGDSIRGGHMSHVITCAVNDYITFHTYQGTGSAQNLETNRTKATIRFLG